MNERVKILRVRNGEFLRTIHQNMIETTWYISEALDLSTLSFNQLAHVMSNLNGKEGLNVEVIEVTRKVQKRD